MKKFWIGVTSLVAVLVVIVGVAMVPWRLLGDQKRPIRVVTGMDFYGEVAQKVAGKHGQVVSFINNPAVDPHDYQPGTKQSQQVGNANVVIENGLGYDPWMNKMVKSNAQKGTKVITVSKLVNKHNGDNEHLWYDPATMKKLATALADQYSKIDPQHRQDYQQNARKYLASLKPLDKEITQLKANVNQNNKQVAVSEPVFDYALSNLGYQVMDKHFEKAVEDGSDPSPSDIKGIQDAITNHEIAFFVDNSQASDTVVRNLVKLANQHDVPVLKVTETEPKGQSYQQWMLKQYRALAKIQQSSKN